LQYRDKDATNDELRRTAEELMLALSGRCVPLVINDRVEIAREVGADGVHLGQEDMHPGMARRILGRAAIIGRTIKTMADVHRLRDEPIDYACIGGIFASSTKLNMDPPLGIAGLRRLRQAIIEIWPELPISAIAGIKLASAGPIIEVGADGIAIVGAVLKTDDPRAATLELRHVIDAALASRQLLAVNSRPPRLP
jgi:thiamine-phosphate pyrophosphorylase